ALAAALLVGALAPLGPLGAWLRVMALAGAVAIATILLALRLRGRLPGWDGFLQQVEARFPDLRSWIRNAVDFAPGAGAHTSAERPRARGQGAARRAERTALAALHPRLEPGRPLVAAGAAAALVALLFVLAPSAAHRSWATLWHPAAAAPMAR